MEKRSSDTAKPRRRKDAPRRWGGQENAAPAEARERIIAAARHCYTRKDIAQTTMADIAAQAKVVRATLYRYFPNRESVLLAVYREEIRSFLDRFTEDVGKAESFCAFLLDYCVFAVRQAGTTPLHRQFFEEQSALWVSRNYLSDAESLELTVAFFRESFQVAKRVGEIRDDLDLAEVVEFLVRVLMSFMLVPEAARRTETQLRRYFEKHLVRGLRRPG
ncbi:TetR/AcrR family transcriptional regulator [Solimonas sp. K1W22B-7]|uniref:TetR/AcrR family transcriptional regulator n=1 Tax=Solimonas sp. K1W22B-7 TaxID=2303331 RepID=UPI000E32ECDE|nr:TetR/AcrR family transcriptional regulator [Solimonas sp. K1W22B-7]AXQ28735.1 TetR/AcrR family transcriptional regulator [Solimonas sp. K1W22B-7]